MTAKTSFTKEFLEALYATDTTPRVISGQTSIEIACSTCQGTKSTIKMSQIMDKVRKLGIT